MKRLMVFAAAVVVAGCSLTDPSPPAEDLMPGTLSFDFTGAGVPATATFTAAGSVSASNPVWGTESIAVAEASTNFPSRTLIVAGTPKSGTKWDQLVLNVNRASVGTTVIDTTCFGYSADCRLGATAVQVEFSADHAVATFPKPWICAITRGTVTIAAIATRRVSGSFSGTGLCVDPYNALTPFTVTNGTFDVGVVIPGKPVPRG